MIIFLPHQDLLFLLFYIVLVFSVAAYLFSYFPELILQILSSILYVASHFSARFLRNVFIFIFKCGFLG